MDLTIDYTIYQQNITTLARTLVVNSLKSADIINARMVFLGYSFDPNDKTTWKYYQNLAGVYHASNLAGLGGAYMQIKSLDTGEMIDFTQANMQIHLTTWRSYQYGSEYYQGLIAAYPDHVPLIKGILNPIPYTVSTLAQDFQILYYNTDLVESRETNLIPKLQAWIYTYVEQWYHHDYVYVTEDLFHQYFLGALYLAMANALSLFRIQNIGTNQAHSFHIWAHILSFADLEQYKPYLNEFQTLYLYRNIVWIIRNPGAQHAFQALLDNILTERSISIHTYNAQHNTANLLTDLVPEVQFSRELLNMQDSIANTPYFRTTAEILQDEIPLAKNNVDVYQAQTVNTAFQVSTNRNSTLPTKVLESDMQDLSESVVYPQALTLLNEWARLADIGLYVSIVSVLNPNTGVAMSMSVKEAFVLYLYGVWQAHGVTLDKIPYWNAQMVLRIPRPTLPQLQATSSSPYVTDNFIRYALALCPDIPKLISTSAFYETALAISTATQLHRDLYAYRTRFAERAEFETLVLQLYEDHLVDLGGGLTYQQFFQNKGWALDDISKEDWASLTAAILNTATGQDTANKQKLADIQAAMIGLTLKVSSYTIQAIVKINEDAIPMLDYPMVRVGGIHQSAAKTHDAFSADVRIIAAPQKTAMTYSPKASFHPEGSAHLSGRVVLWR